MSLNELEYHYKSFESQYNIIKTKCKENKCGLKGIKNDSFLILDGDEIEKSMKRSNANKSVDCIIINKKHFNDNSYEVILCELTKGKNKTSKELKEKFENSSMEIYQIFNKFNLKFRGIKCLFLGNKIKNNKRCYNEFNKPLNLRNVKINGVCPKDIIIQMEDCGFDINNLNS